MTDDLEDAVAGFVELEAELTAATGGTYREGSVSGGSKVPIGDVPDGDPVVIPTDHALRLAVDDTVHRVAGAR